jgi:hypothetical protein
MPCATNWFYNSEVTRWPTTTRWLRWRIGSLRIWGAYGSINGSRWSRPASGLTPCDPGSAVAPWPSPSRHKRCERLALRRGRAGVLTSKKPSNRLYEDDQNQITIRSARLVGLRMLDGVGAADDQSSIVSMGEPAPIDFRPTEAFAPLQQVGGCFDRFSEATTAERGGGSPCYETGFEHGASSSSGRTNCLLLLFCRDALLWLQEVCRQAIDAGVNTAPVLQEVAALSSSQNRYGMGSTREMLINMV